MKKLVKMAAFVGALMVGNTALAIDNEVVFLCSTPDGSHAMLEYTADTDVFILSYGNDLDVPEVTVMKRGKNIGTTYFASAAENSTLREIYISDGKKFYTLGVSDKGNSKSGYFQIMDSGSEIKYQDCDSSYFRAKFDDFNLFKNMTSVD